MVHLLSVIFFLTALAGAGALVVRLIREDGERIAGALLRQVRVEARPWSSRVRMVSMRPSAARLPSRRAAA